MKLIKRGYNLEDIDFKGITFHIYDVGGDIHVRNVWQYFSKKLAGIVYVFDSTDKTRLHEALNNLNQILQSKHTKNIPLLFFWNKQDVPGAFPVKDLLSAMSSFRFKDHPLYIQACSTVTGDGLFEGFNWLSKILE